MSPTCFDQSHNETGDEHDDENISGNDNENEMMTVTMLKMKMLMEMFVIYDDGNDESNDEDDEERVATAILGSPITVTTSQRAGIGLNGSLLNSAIVTIVTMQ